METDDMTRTASGGGTREAGYGLRRLSDSAHLSVDAAGTVVLVDRGGPPVALGPRLLARLAEAAGRPPDRAASDGARDEVRRRLAACGLSQREVARRAGVSQSALSRWLAGRNVRLSEDDVRRIGAAL